MNNEHMGETVSYSSPLRKSFVVLLFFCLILFVSLKYAEGQDFDEDGITDELDNCPSDYNPGQQDSYPPPGDSIGDPCDCEGNFNCDPDQDGTDAAVFKVDFGRSVFSNPCENGNSCQGDFDCDLDVDGAETTVF